MLTFSTRVYFRIEFKKDPIDGSGQFFFGVLMKKLSVFEHFAILFINFTVKTKKKCIKIS